MLDAVPPLEEIKSILRSVPPLSTHHTTTSSTPAPALCSLDGGASHAFRGLPLAPRPPSCPPSLDAGMKTIPLPDGQATAMGPFSVPDALGTDHDHEGMHDTALGRETAKELPQPDSKDQTESQSPQTVPVPAVPSLSRLTRLLRLQHYQTVRLQQLQAELRGLQIAAARATRFTAHAASVYQTLAECLRTEDKVAFLTLFSAFEDAAGRCSDLSPLARDPSGDSATSGSFLDRLPGGSQEAVTVLLRKVRWDGEFLADRLGSLSASELALLLPDVPALRSSRSVFESATGSFVRASRTIGYTVDSQTDTLASSGFGRPLETLVHALRGLCAGPLDGDEHSLQLWSSVCARLLGERRPGSERLCLAILDIWASASAWPGRARLQLWVQQTLQRGAFLLARPSKQSFRMRVQTRPERPDEDEARAETFYREATVQLLDLLIDSTGPSVIHPSALRMCSKIRQQLPPHVDHNRSFARFVLTRWVSTYFAEATTAPEAFGMLNDTYISEHARSMILREIASRTQKVILDVLKHGATVPTETSGRVEALLSRLQEDSVETSAPLRPSGKVSAAGKDSDLCVVSALDVTTILRALYPQRRPASVSSDSYALRSGLRSSASSISGFSLFQSPASETSSATLTWPVTVASPDGPDLLNLPKWSNEYPSVASEVEHAQKDFDANLLWEASSLLDEYFDTKGSDSEQWAVLVLPRGSVNDGNEPLSPVRTPKSDPESAAVEKRLPPHMVVLVRNLLRARGDLARESTLDDGQDDDENLEVGVQEAYRALLDAMQEHQLAAEDDGDFVQSHHWWMQEQAFRAWLGDRSLHDALANALRDLEKQAGADISTAEIIAKGVSDSRAMLSPTLADRNRAVGLLKHRVGELRDKMWYVADVRTSAPYDEARSVANALRIMGKPKRAARSRAAPPLRHWSTPKLSATGLHLKTEAQILDLLGADSSQGGPNKLSDDQSRATANWMEANNVENLCPAEERLHRFCMEVRKCVDQLTAAEYLSANSLFARDPLLQERTAGMLSVLQATTGRRGYSGWQARAALSMDGASSASQQLSSAGSREFLDDASPTLTHKSSAPFWSPALTESLSPSSATSVGTSTAQAVPLAAQRWPGVATRQQSRRSVAELRQYLTGLLLSDLATTLFNEGSETDCAYWTGLGREITSKQLNSIALPTLGSAARVDYACQSAPPANFDYTKAFQQMMHAFAATPNPTTKLSLLCSIDKLLPDYMRPREDGAMLLTATLTSDQVEMPSVKKAVNSTDANIEGFRRLFATSDMRPATIFRDLQYIAALIPSSVLDMPSGRAFCNAAVAVTRLRQEMHKVFVETADSIISYHTNNRGHGRKPSTAQEQRDSATFAPPSRTPSAEEVARYSMKDAADLLIVAAKEGDAAAQRELGTLYLTNPDLIDHVLAPFTRPRDVFKEEMQSKWKDQDPNRCDPATMCVAHHWMSLSSKGGDPLAQKTLRQREEMDRLP